jgi:CTP:phosphocholine cytidylyltransferase-like protein
MAVVILVAGSGKRFRDKKPKCLSMVKEKTLLERTIEMIRLVDEEVPIRIVTGYNSMAIEKKVSEMMITGLTVMKNEHYLKDQNILSAQLGMSGVESDVLVLEGDCLYNEASMREFVSSIGSGRNIIFSIGRAEIGKKNAVVRSDGNGRLTGYMIGERSPEFESTEWSNMSGAALFSMEDLEGVISWLDISGSNPAETYYFQPLVDSNDFSVSITKLGKGSEFSTFNTQKQYLEIMAEMGVETKIKLIDTESLLHVEGFSEKRVNWLRRKIEEEGVWNKPICIDSEHGIVMDGQHRMEVAREMGLSVIPAIGFSHSEVEFWSLRPKNHEVTKELIIKKSLSGDIYPYKTVKYSFPTEILGCSIDLEELL